MSMYERRVAQGEKKNGGTYVFQLHIIPFTIIITTVDDYAKNTPAMWYFRNAESPMPLLVGPMLTPVPFFLCPPSSASFPLFVGRSSFLFSNILHRYPR